MSLEKYNNKRDFKKTSEPKGDIKKTKSKKLKFVNRIRKKSLFCTIKIRFVKKIIKTLAFF